MITLLRRIRKSLIEAGSARKYLVYAIGEIVLVVIGILIALQINNWNEERKLQEKQTKLLKELVLSVEEIVHDNMFMLRINEGSLKAADRLIAHIEKDLPYSDSLPLYFAMAHNRWVALVEKHAYQNARTFGLDFITNDTTRKQLTSLFEGQLDYLEKLDERNNEFYFHNVVPVLLHHFEEVNPQGEFYGALIPLNYSFLVQDQQYLTLVKSSKKFRNQYYDWQRDYIESMEELGKRLERELAHRR